MGGSDYDARAIAEDRERLIRFVDHEWFYDLVAKFGDSMLAEIEKRHHGADARVVFGVMLMELEQVNVELPHWVRARAIQARRGALQSEGQAGPPERFGR